MKRILVMLCAGLMVTSINADEQKNIEQQKIYTKTQILTLVKVGKIDQKTLMDAVTWIEKSIYPPITVNTKNIRYSKKFADKELLFAKLKQMNADNLAIVALVEQMPKGTSISNSVNIAGNAGIVYIQPYRTKYAKDNPELELYKWRVNKEALKASALALGLKECPFPRCCLSPDYDDARIDEKGRNLCPPCWKKMSELMKSKGIAKPLPPHLKKIIQNKTL